jgi:hypothetical protein
VHKKGSKRSFLYALTGGFALLIAAWSSPGLAAAHAAVGCDRTAQDLKSLDAGPLRIEGVDLSDVAGSPESSDNLTESVAPLLFLTPRVASILEDVFGDSDGAKRVAKATPVKADPEQQKPASSPVVDNASTQDRAAPVASPMYEHAAILPRFQRQMYRTDI